MKNSLVISLAILLIGFNFLAQSCKKDTPKIPVVTTIPVSEVSYTTAASGGEVTRDGGSPVISRGVCWGTTTEPTISESKTTESLGTGAFTSSLTLLTANTLYYVRAYATNIAGTGYGDQVTFTTSQIATATLTTTGITLITPTGAASGGNITSENGGSVTARGVCWSTSQNPVITGTHTTDGTGTGIFTSSITGLTAGTLYYVRSYATNTVGTSYGVGVSFTTSSTVSGAPTIGTATAGNGQATITFTAPSNNGGSAITGYTVTSSPGGLTGTGSASPITVTGLTNGTAYTFSVTATNTMGNSVASSASNSVTLIPSITDIDLNVYKIVTIGTQVWMAENLKTTKYNDGTAIPNVLDNTAWAALTTGAYSDYSNTPFNSTNYGRLYNWYVVDNNATTKVASNGGKNVCPTGWHIPSNVEWTTLTTYLGGSSVAGGKLKEIGLTHWLTPNTGATNETDFSALPGGKRGVGGDFASAGTYGFLWSSTEGSATWGLYRMLFNTNAVFQSTDDSKKNGLSVRCVKD